MLLSKNASISLSFSCDIPLVPPSFPLREVKWWHLLQAVITVWFQYSKWAISPTASGRCSLPCPININTHTHIGESALICMEGEIMQVHSCGREGVMEVLMLTDHPDTSCCCICIFTAVLSPSDLFTVYVTVTTGTVGAHVHLRQCHFWLSYDDGDTWCGVRCWCFSTQFHTCLLLSISWEHLECVCRTPASGCSDPPTQSELSDYAASSVETISHYRETALFSYLSRQVMQFPWFWLIVSQSFECLSDVVIAHCKVLGVATAIKYDCWILYGVLIFDAVA